MPDTVVFVPAVNRPKLNKAVRKRLKDEGISFREADPMFHGESPRVTGANGCVQAKTFRECMSLAASTLVGAAN